MQIKVIYDYYSSKRVTPFFIGEEELLEYDFEALKERLVREVPHLAKITSLSAAPLHITMNDEKKKSFRFKCHALLVMSLNITFTELSRPVSKIKFHMAKLISIRELLC